MIRVTISIINFNGRRNTLDCLSSISKIARKDFDLEILVIDNGSSEKFGIPKGYRNVRLISSNRNLGFSGGHNIGIKKALENKSDYILILNNDTILDGNLIKELLGTFNENIGIVSPKIYFAKGHEFHKNRYKDSEKGHVFWYAGGQMDWANVIGKHRGVDEVDTGQYDKTQSTDFATGCCMMVKREVFEKVGFFNEKYFLYYEDNDLSQRTKQLGFDIIYNPKGVLWHKNAGSVGGSGSDLQDYYITRNRMLFGMKFAPIRSKFSLIRESLALLLYGRAWQRKGIMDYYIGRLGKGSYE